MRVLVLPEVRLYLNELSQILYEKDYFSYLETSERYVEELFEAIKTTLPRKQRRYASPFFDRYGKDMYYSIFRKNRQTQWYVFFNIYEDKGELIYLVRYISNNHMIAHLL
ncbi:hypothetical protein M2133_000864 [Parabacteroides sp. PF5-6]|nr:hypothetical protein [Parabacteroides sp. PF5-6]